MISIISLCKIIGYATLIYLIIKIPTQRRYVKILKNQDTSSKQLNNKLIVEYTKTIKGNPNDVETLKKRGGIFCDNGKFKKAIADYNKAIEIAPEDIELYMYRGYAVLQTDIQKAIDDFNKVIEKNPCYDGAYLNRANCYDLLNKNDLAIADYSKAIELNPNSAETYGNRGAAYAKIRDVDRAILDYNKSISINPNLPHTCYLRAVAYFNKQEFNSAWEDVHKAESLGYKINTKFLTVLRKASGRRS